MLTTCHPLITLVHLALASALTDFMAYITQLEGIFNFKKQGQYYRILSAKKKITLAVNVSANVINGLTSLHQA